MNTPRIAAQSHQGLDARFAQAPAPAALAPPAHGWIKTIREALGMSSAQLAKRLAIKQPTLAALDAMVPVQARKATARQWRSIEHSMTLEDQAVPAADFEARLDALARDINPRKPWDEA
jgi:hypothetical protein